MPRGDGTGPSGQGHGQGHGRGRGRGMDSDGTCFCPKCGHTQAHARGTPCAQVACPKCGAMMTRQQ